MTGPAPFDKVRASGFWRATRPAGTLSSYRPVALAVPQGEPLVGQGVGGVGSATCRPPGHGVVPLRTKTLNEV